MAHRSFIGKSRGSYHSKESNKNGKIRWYCDICHERPHSHNFWILYWKPSVSLLLLLLQYQSHYIKDVSII